MNRSDEGTIVRQIAFTFQNYFLTTANTQPLRYRGESTMFLTRILNMSDSLINDGLVDNAADDIRTTIE